MIKTLKLQLLGALFLGTLTLAGCKDECKDVTCVQGACVDGNCVCDAGYEGADCAAAFNNKVNGTYTLSEVCDTNGTRSYPITVAAKSGSTTEFTISELWQSSQDAVTAVIGSNGLSFTVAKQDLGSSGLDLEASNGTISSDGKTITLTYRIYNDDTIYLESCNATLSR